MRTLLVRLVAYRITRTEEQKGGKRERERRETTRNMSKILFKLEKKLTEKKR